MVMWTSVSAWERSFKLFTGVILGKASILTNGILMNKFECVCVCVWGGVVVWVCVCVCVCEEYLDTTHDTVSAVW